MIYIAAFGYNKSELEKYSRSINVLALIDCRNNHLRSLVAPVLGIYCGASIAPVERINIASKEYIYTLSVVLRRRQQKPPTF